ncbi:hypothetical protein SAMN05892883_0281 [Jatrophihabitans sp. GAS493]|uniref:hypothetical protein n=1 Tax=Jatrophihabitans sp. GAS493 TaxID=1907575 RepID=UPI000BB91A4D|nr:hypothetical protein [Jatrophihabitans sp. GAS493]SOD70600.1 hypothetical protein SAMN05892883_0281 [Jatrophihabitans sp. GAS493]
MLLIAGLTAVLATPASAASVPAGRVDVLDAGQGNGIRIGGWAFDPAAPSSSIFVDVYINGAGHRITANNLRADVNAAFRIAGAHGFGATFAATPGTYSVCAYAIGVRNPAAHTTLTCQTVVVPFGRASLDIARMTPGGIYVSGWAYDFSSDAATHVDIYVNSSGRRLTTGAARPDVASAFNVGSMHGFSATVPATAGTYNVCAYAIPLNPIYKPVQIRCIRVVLSDLPFGSVDSVRQVTGGIQVTGWAIDPNADTPLTIAAYAGPVGKALVANVSRPDLAVTFPGFSAAHGFNGIIAVTGLPNVCVYAINVGPGAPNKLLACVNALPPVQTTSPPVSTSRYVRNLTGSASDVAFWQAAGITDAQHNPGGHEYTTLLDIGGQRGGGIVGLSATSIRVTYAQLVTAMNAYVDGYASAQQYSAPATIAIGTNNDVSVSYAMGVEWAQKVIAPVAAHAAGYSRLTIAGADDIEPGFRGTPANSLAWVQGFLAGGSAPFVFNGSADGCNWTVINGKCNNGWTAAGLYQMSGGLSPTRMRALPQIYNTTMAAQWKYISLTGVVGGHPKVSFGGVLTELTACAQAGGSCYSMPGVSAWRSLWSQLSSDPRSSLSSMPWSTDLRIN